MKFLVKKPPHIPIQTQHKQKDSTKNPGKPWTLKNSCRKKKDRLLLPQWIFCPGFLRNFRKSAVEDGIYLCCSLPPKAFKGKPAAKSAQKACAKVALRTALRKSCVPSLKVIATCAKKLHRGCVSYLAKNCVG